MRKNAKGTIVGNLNKPKAANGLLRFKKALPFYHDIRIKQ